MTSRAELIAVMTLALLTPILVSCARPGPATPIPNQALTAEPATLQRTVDAVAGLRKGDGFPQHLKRRDAVKTGEDFDVNVFFSALPRLSMKPGYVLDWVYFYNDAEGFPVIYAREGGQPPYRTYSEYKTAEDGIVARRAWSKAMEQIKVDGTAEGFFEFAVLRIMGKQFYLWWHANYDDLVIICDDTGLEKVLKSGGISRLPSNIEKKARRLDFRPVVEFEDKTAIVNLVTFTKWGGFIQKSYTISRDFPHKVIKEESKTLLEYRTNVVF